jgi:hypothetical protein
MSMSTRIEDLPGPIPEDVLEDLSDIQNNIRQETEQQVKHNTIQNKHISDVKEYEMYKDVPNESNIKMNVRKRVKFEDKKQTQDENLGIFSFLKSQINEENALLLIFLILASRNEMDNYIKLYTKSSDFFTNIIRCVLILLIYILFKHFLLPKIKL